MNREQAINYLISCGFTEEQLSEVVRALTYQPTTKNDLGVEEVTALAEWTEKLTKASEDAYNKGYADGMKEQEPRKGHWIVNRKIDTAYDISGYKSWAISYVCEHCGFIHQAIENHGVYNYCPNCGAKIVEPQESEEV